VNFKHFAGFKLQSVYNHSPKFQSLKSFRIKVTFVPKYAPNGLHGAGVPYSINQCFESRTASMFRIPYSINVSLRCSINRPTRISIPKTFWIKILHSPILSKLLNPVKNSASWWRMIVRFTMRLQFGADVILISNEPVICFGRDKARFVFGSKNVGSQSGLHSLFYLLTSEWSERVQRSEVKFPPCEHTWFWTAWSVEFCISWLTGSRKTPNIATLIRDCVDWV